MNSSTKTAEALLVIGDDDLAATLRRHNGREVRSVSHYLAALGELSRRQFSVIVGRLDPMAGSVGPSVRALRDLAPQARILLIVTADQEPEAMRAVRLGMDDYLVEPIPSDRIVEALESNSRNDVAASMLHADVESATTNALNGHAHPDDAAESEAPPAGAEAILPSDDMQLLEQMLGQRGSMRDRAIQLLRRRVGTEDVHWSAEPDNEAQVCVPVRFGQQSLGHLISNTAVVGDLIEHAAWLSRWLALEQHMGQLQEMAMRDELTGLWNRRYFDQFLDAILRRARQQRFRVTLMVFDIDDFKAYNDRFGHPEGDEILREAARLMLSGVRQHDVVARIGGDEFAVIFWDADPPRRAHSEHPRSVRRATERLRAAICNRLFPKLAEDAPGTLTISAGLASYPWDGQRRAELIDLADQMLLKSKQQGKNVITFGPGALKVCALPEEEAET